MVGQVISVQCLWIIWILMYYNWYCTVCSLVYFNYTLNRKFSIKKKFLECANYILAFFLSIDTFNRFLNLKIQEGEAHNIFCPAYDCFQLVPVDIIESVVSKEMDKRYLQFDIKVCCQLSVWFPKFKFY